VEPLEPGWSVQRYTLREHGVVVAGPDLRELLGPVNPEPAATRWAQQTLDDRRADFISRSWAARNEDGGAPPDDMTR
jgi:hypothetical protein